MSNPDTTARYLLKPAAVAAVSGAAAAAWRPGTNVLIMGQAYPLPLVVAGASFVASEVSELVNSYMFSHLPTPKLLEAPLHTGLNIGTQVGVVCAIENFLSPGLIGDQGLAEVAALCALGEVVGSYLTTNWLSGWYSALGASE